MNGVLVGKTKVREAILASGMEIQIGDTILRYVERGEVVSLKKKESKDNAAVEFIKTVPKPILMSLSFFVIALALLFITSGNDKGSKPEQPAVVNSQKPIKENSINLYLNNGMHFMNSASWNEAIAEFRKVLSVDPDNFEAGAMKEKAETESGYQEIMEKAANDAAEGKMKEAVLALEKIPSTSVYYDMAGEEIVMYQEMLNTVKQD